MVALALEPRAGLARRKNSAWSAVLPVSGGECSVSASSFFDLNKKDKRKFLRAKTAWWSSYNMPIISFEDENSREIWQPDAVNCVRDDGDYVIIAKVFTQAR
jgi:hypothetical protein